MKTSNPRKPSSYMIFGRNPVREAILHKRNNVLEIYISKDSDLMDKKGRLLISTIKDNNIPLRLVDKNQLQKLCGSENHQGFIALIKSSEKIEFNDFVRSLETKDTCLILCLDSIFDPHNLGAILRAAECFSVDAVIWSKNRGASITPVTTKASAGATELVTTIQVSNLANALRKLKDKGIWVLSATNGDGALPLNTYSFPKMCAVVLGSEGSGVSRIIKNLSNLSVCIPMTGHIDSLNVSQAASVLLYEICRQRSLI